MLKDCMRRALCSRTSCGARQSPTVARRQHAMVILAPVICSGLLVIAYFEGALTTSAAGQGSHTLGSRTQPPWGPHPTPTSASAISTPLNGSATARLGSGCSQLAPPRCYHHPLLYTDMDALTQQPLRHVTPSSTSSSTAHQQATSAYNSRRGCVDLDQETVTAQQWQQQQKQQRLMQLADALRQRTHQARIMPRPQHVVVAASRAAVQAYLDSAAFAQLAAQQLAAGTAAPRGDFTLLPFYQLAPSHDSSSMRSGEHVVGDTRTATEPQLLQQQPAVHHSTGSLSWQLLHDARKGSNCSGGVDEPLQGRTVHTQKGILVVAGGRKLLTHLVVLLKVLREVLGCTLPVEVAWQGASEMDEATLRSLQHTYGPLTGFDVQAKPYPPYMRRVALTRWVGKVAALLHCSFQEVLLLDSDNLPLVDPSALFEDPLYQQHGNLFWPDFWSGWVKPGVYPWLGLNRTLIQPVLSAGAGFTQRDAESGMVLLDRRRWLKVLYWAFWINTWHQQLYYRVIHGDKDTFALAFALAGQADKYRQSLWCHSLDGAFQQCWGSGWHYRCPRKCSAHGASAHNCSWDEQMQAYVAGLRPAIMPWRVLNACSHGHCNPSKVSIGPGGVFHFGKGVLEVKPSGNNTRSTTDGWQLVGALQYDDAGVPVFFHRTMNKMSLDEDPWPAELVTGPLPTRWLEYFLAHDNKGPTKGVWWEHVAPAHAFYLIQGPNHTATHTDVLKGNDKATPTTGQKPTPWWQQGGQRRVDPGDHRLLGTKRGGSSLGGANSVEGLNRHDITAGCDQAMYQFYTQAQQEGLPVDFQQQLSCACSKGFGSGVYGQSHRLVTKSSMLPVGKPGSGSHQAPDAPVAAALVTTEFVELSSALQVINASVQALAWLKTSGLTLFPALAPGSRLP